jgi:hypothetical protein
MTRRKRGNDKKNRWNDMRGDPSVAPSVILSVSEESPHLFLSSPNSFIGDPDQFLFITEINLLVNYFFYFLNSILYGNNKLFLVLWIPAIALNDTQGDPSVAPLPSF